MHKYAMITLGLFLVLDYSSSECQRRLILRTMRYPNCIPKRIVSFGCKGTCNSYTAPSPSRPDELEHHCQCCQDAERRIRRAIITCPDTESPRQYKNYTVRLAIPTECSCRPCSVLPNRIIPSEPDFLQGKRSMENHNYTIPRVPDMHSLAEI